jgi:dTDP-4-amino-4,6-dideoxygalactose transaminase
MTTPVPFIDLAAQQARIRCRLDEALARVMAHGQYVMGPEIDELEARLAAFCGVRHCVACSSGTDALVLALMALAVGPGDAVLVPSLTFAATAEAVALLGASPVFVDVLADTLNMDAVSARHAVSAARRAGLRPVGVVPVDFLGLPADYDALLPMAAASGLWLLADAAQSFGAIYKGRPVGTLGRATATSFFPAKPLGCYGDGGAVLTDDTSLFEVIRSLRVHGQGAHKYDNVRVGMNARLDTLQAAILLQKLLIFPDELERRQHVAARYGELLGDVVGVPRVPDGLRSTWAQYSIRHAGRDGLARSLAAAGIPTAIYYPTPMHRQPAYRHYPVAEGGCPVTEQLCADMLSLPMHPYLDDATQRRIAAAARHCLM